MSLVDALITAQHGYRSDAAALWDVLTQSEVFVALARGGVEQGQSEVRAGTMLSLHSLPSGDGTMWTAAFSSGELLDVIGRKYQWTTDGGTLMWLSANGRDFLANLIVSGVPDEAAPGVLFDAEQPSQLALNGREIHAMVAGAPIPLTNYAAAQPARGDEQMMIGEPAVPPPPDVYADIERVIAAEPGTAGYRLCWAFCPERDAEAHFLLDIHTTGVAFDRAGLSRYLGGLVSPRLPPPGYVDIAFDFGR